MKAEFSRTWNSSTQPRKQRKYRFNAPKHTRSKLMHASLSKELRKKYGTRTARIRVGDKVAIMRGQFRKKEGKVEEVDMKELKAYVTKIETLRRDGARKKVPLEPSNLQIVELNLEDKRRKSKMESYNRKGAN